MSTQFCPYCMSPVEPDAPCKNCGLTAGTYTPAPHHLPPGTILRDRYLIGRVLGEGGFGITYIGCDLQLELKVAIKEYFPTDKANRVSQSSLSVSNYSGSVGQRYEEGKLRFLQEARTMARMDKQPVIVSAKDFFEANNTAYIVMEYVEGTTLKELVNQRGGRIPVDELFRLMEPLFSALSAMHELGLIHRDISPENLMLEQGVIRLLDFGCARESSDGNATLTIALKHGYAPIEQYQNKGQGPWTDVYALSATIYYCLTGKKPAQAMDRLCEDELILPRKLGIPLTETQEKALLYGMGIRPRRRFRSIEELRAALYSQEAVFPDEVLETMAVTELGSDEKKETEDASLEQTTDTAEKNASADITGAPEATEEPAQKTDEARPSGGFLKKLTKNQLIAIVTGAAIALILFLCVLFALGNQPAAEEQAPEQPPVSVPADLEYVKADSVEAINVLLADEDVEAVTIPAGAEVYLERGELIVNKPLRVEEGARLTSYQGITLVENGLFVLEGEFYSEGALLAMQGGAIMVAENGVLENYDGLVWLERESDLYAAPGSQVNLGEDNTRYLVLDQEELFENATVVTTDQGFLDAVNAPGVTSIIVEGDVTLTPESRYVTVPLMVSPGATLTAEWNEDDNLSAALCLGGTVFINGGTFRGEVNNLGADEGPVAIINHAYAEAGFFLANEQGIFLNMYDWTAPGGQAQGGSFYNFGEFHIQGGEDYYTDGWVGFTNPMVGNYGHITLESESENAMAWLDLNNGVAFRNGGLIEWNRNSGFSNCSYMLNFGELRFNDTSTEFQQHGILEVQPFSLLDASLVEHMDLLGAILHYDETSVLLPEGDYPNKVLYIGGGEVAETEEDLRRLMEDDSVSYVLVNEPMELHGDLTVNKGLSAMRELTLKNGNLFVDGPESYLVTWNTMRVDGEVHVRDGAALVGLSGAEQHCGDLLKVEESTVVFRGPMTMRPGTVELSHGSWLVALEDLNLDEVHLRMEYHSVLHAFSPMRLANCVVDIGENGELRSVQQLVLDENTYLTNWGGVVDLSTMTGQEQLIYGEVTNHGAMDIWNYVRLDGVLANHGRIQLNGRMTVIGRLDNQGSIFTFDGAEIYGEVNGNPPREGSQWTSR